MAKPKKIFVKLWPLWFLAGSVTFMTLATPLMGYDIASVLLILSIFGVFGFKALLSD